MYYLSLFLTIFANILYHFAQKSTSEKINPMFSLIITYSVALFLSLILFFSIRGEKSLMFNIQQLNFSSILLGGAIVLLELGFLLAYRAGWNISTASILSTIVVTIALIPIGILLFKDNINKQNILGIVISILGIILINKK